MGDWCYALYQRVVWVISQTRHEFIKSYHPSPHVVTCLPKMRERQWMKCRSQITNRRVTQTTQYNMYHTYINGFQYNVTYT